MSFKDIYYLELLISGVEPQFVQIWYKHFCEIILNLNNDLSWLSIGPTKQSNS